MKKGSITVFAALCFLFTASALFVLLEAARVWGLGLYAEWRGRRSVEYVAAEYQPYLWENYHLLLYDGGGGENQFEIGRLTGEVRRASIGKSQAGTDLFPIEMNHIYAPEYSLLTDQEGEIFLEMVTSYMKQNLSREVAEGLYKKWTKQEEFETENGNVEETMKEAGDGLEAARKKAEAEERPVPSDVENPIEIVGEAGEKMQKSLLEYLLPDGAEISDRKMNLDHALEKRDLEEGNGYRETNFDWYEKVLAARYAGEMFSCYGKQKEGQAYFYGMEYLIGGKETERENLEAVVKQLLIARTAANMTAILSDPEKMEQVYVVTTALAGFAVDPFLHKTVKIAVVGAWAYLESIQDVRALLDGGKIALLKDCSQWTTELSDMKETLMKKGKAKECENGWTYEEYLMQRLLVMDEKKLAFRMMNFMEQNLMSEEEYENCRMDHMLVSFSYRMQFQAKPLFPTLSVLPGNRQKSYYFETEKGVSYIP